MRVGPMPSNPGGGGVPPEALLPIATGLYGGAQAYNQISTTHNDSLNRSLQRDKSLSSGTITPRQYVFQCAQDFVSPKKIKRGLLAWGGRHEGFDYSHPKHFDVQGKLLPSDNPLKMALGIKVQSCSLKLYKAGQTTEVASKSSSLNVPVDLDPAAKKGPKGPDGGLRGGYTPPPELEEATADVEHLTTSSYRYQPNLSCDVSEEYVEGLSSREVADVFTCENTQLLSPIWVYAISLGLAFCLSLLFNKFTKRSSTRKGSKDSQEPVSALEEDRSVEACERPLVSYIVKQCEGQGLDGPPTRGTPEFLLKIFESYKRGTITRKGTTRILMICYNLSREEALEWLEEE